MTTKPGIISLWKEHGKNHSWVKVMKSIRNKYYLSFAVLISYSNSNDGLTFQPSFLQGFVLQKRGEYSSTKYRIKTNKQTTENEIQTLFRSNKLIFYRKLEIDADYFKQ